MNNASMLWQIESWTDGGWTVLADQFASNVEATNFMEAFGRHRSNGTLGLRVTRGFPRTITVDEAIAELSALSDNGHGERPLQFDTDNWTAGVVGFAFQEDNDGTGDDRVGVAYMIK